MRIIFVLLVATTFWFCDSKTEKNESQEMQKTDKNKTDEQSTNQNSGDIEQIKNVIPKGFELVKSDEGESLIFANLNDDNITDAVALIVKGNNLKEYDFDSEVRLAVFFGTDNGYKLFNMSGDFGGETIIAMGSKHIDVKNKVISYFHQSMRYDLELKFRYEQKFKDVMLIGIEANNYGNAVSDGSGNTSINYLSGLKIINENKWNEQKEELEELPEQKIKFNQPLKSISDIDYDTMFDDL